MLIENKVYLVFSDNFSGGDTRAMEGLFSLVCIDEKLSDVGLEKVWDDDDRALEDFFSAESKYWDGDTRTLEGFFPLICCICYQYIMQVLVNVSPSI